MSDYQYFLKYRNRYLAVGGSPLAKEDYTDDYYNLAKSYKNAYKLVTGGMPKKAKGKAGKDSKAKKGKDTKAKKGKDTKAKKGKDSKAKKGKDTKAKKGKDAKGKKGKDSKAKDASQDSDSEEVTAPLPKNLAKAKGDELIAIKQDWATFKQDAHKLQKYSEFLQKEIPAVVEAANVEASCWNDLWEAHQKKQCTKVFKDKYKTIGVDGLDEEAWKKIKAAASSATKKDAGKK